MWIGAVSLFPEMFGAVTDYGITGRAVRDGLLTFQSWNPREFTHDRHRTVDDRPYGGGPGMLMKIQPLRDAIRAAREAAPGKPCVVYLSPQGETLDQSVVESPAAEQQLILVAGRYEGVDERLIATEVDREVSLGDFVLSGGELAAMAVIDAVTRLIPERWVMRSRQSRILSPTVCWIVRTTPGPKFTKVRRCRMFYWAVTMIRSGVGG